jgi:class 3 adenylate cyclase
MAACPVCAHENGDDDRFCSACGAALMSAPRREERKVLSVLFADLVGFTSRAEQLDPEDVRAVLAPYWARLRAELERFGGTVEKFIGDAVMALFGAPVTREDDPERAVRAALAIRDWARDTGDLQVRIAVTTGEALVLLDVRPSEGEGMASGDVVNTAARLQVAAPVNGVLVSETTYRATRDIIDYEEREAVVAKGKTDPVRVWEAMQARARVGMDVDQRTLLPLVGRTRELDALVGAFTRASELLEPQLVTLVGVPGIGKSRLVSELFQRIEALPEIVLWRQGRALPYGDGVSFWALSEMVKAQAGIHENDPLDVAREKLWASVGAIGGDADPAWLLRQLLPLIGGDPPEGESREESFAAWRAYFEGIAEERPLVIVFEDLHWADDGLLDFVDHVADWASGVPLFVVGTARPELLDRRPGWGGGKLNATTLALSPLADDEAAQIIARVLEQALLSADTQQVLLERAGGNPLYAEQFARLYVERGSAEDLPLPETIQGIIAARLDGLSADEKRLLQDAAVLGKVFWSGAASSLAGLDGPELAQALHSLERKGLIRRERRSAVSGEEEYAFRHVLVRDVGYGQIPRAERGAKHLAAAQWIEGLGRADDHAELVAHHYAAALELTRAAGTTEAALEGDARVAFVRAGDRSYRLGAFPAALRFYTDALALPAGEAERALVRFAYARARLHAEGDRSGLAEVCDALAAAGQTDAAAEAAALAANAAWRSARSGEAEAILTRALTKGWGGETSAGRAELLAERARIIAFAGNLVEADRAAEEALVIADQLGLDGLRATILNTRAVIALQDGDIRRARAEIESALAVGGSFAEQIRAYTNLAVTWDTDGFLGEARRYGRLANEMGRRMGNKLMLIWSQAGEIAEDVFSAGDWDGTLERAHAYLAETAELGGSYLDSGLRLLCAYVHAGRGDDAAAAAELQIGLAAIDAGSGIQAVAPSLSLAARVEQILGNDARATALVDDALSALREASIRAPGLRADMALAYYLAGRGEPWLEIARARFTETGRVWGARLICSGQLEYAAALYSQIGSPHEEATTRFSAAEQLLALGRRADAGAQLDLALPFYERAGANRILARAETLFAAAS